MKKIVVAMPLDEKLQSVLFSELKNSSLINNEVNVDFVHIFKQEDYPYMLPPMIFPNEEQRKDITETLTKLMSDLTKELDIKNKKFHVSYHESPKIGMVEYLNQHKADLAVTLTRKEHNFSEYFSSTFTEYLIKHAPCNVLVLRNS